MRTVYALHAVHHERDVSQQISWCLKFKAPSLFSFKDPSDSLAL